MVTLKASQQGLTKIKQARLAKGWAVDDFRWIEKASEILGVFWEKQGFLAVGISEGTWKRFLAGKSPINAEAFKAYCQVLEVNWEEVVELNNQATIQDKFNQTSSAKMQNQCDWGEAPDVSIFYGRLAELNAIERWIVQENCRLVTLLGMGGIGKTALSVKVAQQVQDKFDFIIWRSLRNAPSIEDILAEIIQFLSKQEETDLPKQLDGRILRALQYLRSSRCLLILDNIESILQAGDRTGKYKPQYEGYGQFLRCIAESSHQSCLILTSREKPKGLAKFEGEALPVRSLQVSGLPETEGRELFNVKGSFTGSESQWQVLISRYGGNPLALKIVASSIRDFFEGSIPQFLEISRESTFIFDDIRDLLDQQFHRVTNLEREIMYWLAINREPVSLLELQSDFVANVPIPEILESLNSLQRRSLVEKSGTGFTQQPVVMEYAIASLIALICDEICSQKISLFKSHALSQATAKDYVRESQISLILKPVAERLIATLGTPKNLATHLKEILSLLKGKSPQETGYAGGNSLNLLHQIQVDLSGFDFSDLKVWQAYLQGVNLHDVNFANSDLSRCVFTENLGNILSATFSPDGQILATCDTDCHVRLWEVKTGKLLLICQGHNNWVRAIAFSPDGQILASCGADCTVKLWNVQDGICIKTLIGHEHEIFSVAFSPIPPTPLHKGGKESPPTLRRSQAPAWERGGGYGGILASASGDRTIKIWDIETGTCLKTLTGHTDWVRAVAFSLDGQILASGSADCTIKLWDVADGKCLKTLAEHTGWVRGLAFSPIPPTPLTKGGYRGILASCSSDRTIKFWDVSQGKCLKTYTGHSNSIYSIAFDREGEILASGSGDRTVKIWDCNTDTCIKTLHGHTNEVCSVAFSPDGYTLVCVSLDQTVKLWDSRTGQCLKTWYGNTDWALPVAFSSDGQILASGSNDKTVKLWDWQTGNCIKSLQGHGDFIYGIAFSPDAQTLASASTDSSIRLWTVSTGKCFQILHGHTDWVYAVAFHPNGILASGSADCTVKFWDVSQGKCCTTLTGHSDKILGIAFDQTGQILASASADQTVRIWDYQTGNCCKILDGHDNRVYGAVFSPDGKTLATCSTDLTVKLWDWQTGECLKTFAGHTNWVFSVAFSPIPPNHPGEGGEIIASASHDQTVRIWDLKTGECRHICTGHTHLVSAVTFSPDGKNIASGSQDQSVRIWDVLTGECNRVLRAKRLYEGMNIAGVKGLTAATITTLQALGALV